MKIGKALSQEIINYIRNNPQEDQTLLEAIYKKFGVQLTQYHLDKHKELSMAKEIQGEEPEDKKKFDVSDGEIFWKYRRGEVRMTVENLDKIFYQYSKHGLNMSQVQVQNEHGLTALEWQSLKRTFDLVKDSDVFSPYSLSQVSDKEACDMIASKIAEKYSPKNMRAVVAYEAGKQRGRAYDKAIKESAEIDYRRQQFEDGLLEYLSSAKRQIVVKKTKDTRDKQAIVHVCDLHIGADIEEERNLPAYNPDVVSQKLQEIAKLTNARKPSKVCVVINGDIIETFTGLNHMNSWKNIDKRYGYGVSATIKAVEIITDFLTKVNNVNEVIIVSGNHDRVTKQRDEDVDGEVCKWVHYILQQQFKKVFPVRWEKDVATYNIGKCGFIFTHGHLGISKKNPDHVVNQYGSKDNLYHMVVMGHLHNRKIVSDNYHNRSIHAPSIFTGNDYSKGLGYSSRSGFLYITTEKHLPVVVDYSI